MEKVVLITTGGTGGHIYPAVALAKELATKLPLGQIHFAGLELNKKMHHSSFPIHTVSRYPSKNPLKKCLIFFKEVHESHRIVKKLKPDVVIGFGSFYTLPFLIAALFQKIPIILHEGNAIPGRVNRLISPFSRFNAHQFPEAKNYLFGIKKQALLPIRSKYQEGKKQSSLEKLGLVSHYFTLFIHGGSLGALAINQHIKECLKYLKYCFSPFQVIHLTGRHEKEDFKNFYDQLEIPSYVTPYSKEMDILWQAADLSIGRAGASTIREVIEFEVPSIFIPYPHAKDQHQNKNALFMSERVGGSLLVKQQDLTPDHLLFIFQKLFAHRCALLRAMRQALKTYKKKTMHLNFADQVYEYIKK